MELLTAPYRTNPLKSPWPSGQIRESTLPEEIGEANRVLNTEIFQIFNIVKDFRFSLLSFSSLLFISHIIEIEKAVFTIFTFLGQRISFPFAIEPLKTHSFIFLYFLICTFLRFLPFPPRFLASSTLCHFPAARTAETQTRPAVPR